MNISYFGMAFWFLTSDMFNIFYMNMYYMLHIVSPIITLIAVFMPKERVKNKPE